MLLRPSVGFHFAEAAVLVAGLWAGACSTVLAQSITTVAGGGVGDNELAVNANLTTPTRAAVDAAGNLYIADYGNRRIRKIAASTGIITTVAGTGASGYSGDGGAATSAKVSSSYGIGVDQSGNIYIADSLNYRVRKIAAQTGVISTIAGTGSSGFSGEGGPASSAAVGILYGLAVDRAGDIYLGDGANNRVRRISAATGRIETVAGNGTAGFGGDGGAAVSASLSLPRQMAFDANQNVYVVDWGNGRIRKIEKASGLISTIAGGGALSGDGIPANQAILNGPRGVAVDSAGNVYVAEREGARVRKIGAATGLITTVAGTGVQGYGGDNGLATAALLNNPYDVVVDGSGNLLITEFEGSRIRRVDLSTGRIASIAGGSIGDGAIATGATFSAPVGLSVDALENLYVADRGQARLRRVSSRHGTISTIAGGGSINSYVVQSSTSATTIAFSNVGAAAIDASARPYLIESENGRIWQISSGSARPYAGAASGAGSEADGLAATATRLHSVEGAAFDRAGNGYVVDRYRIRKVDTSTGIVSTIAGGTIGDDGPALKAYLNTSRSLATDSAGSILVPDASARLRAIRAGGVIQTIAGTGQAGSAGDGGPAVSAAIEGTTWVATDRANNIYIGEATRIRKISVATGRITTVAGNGTQGFAGDGGPALNAQVGRFGGPIAVDGSGSLYISTEGRIRKIDGVGGTISTIAGGSIAGFGGDGGPATNARFGYNGYYNPIALDRDGNIYVSDTDNHRIRKISGATGIVTTIAGSGAPGFSGDGGPATSAALLRPQGLVVDSAGNIYFADWGNSRIRRIAATGVISTIAGRGQSASSGDGEPAINAGLLSVSAVALDGAGDLLILERGRVRKIILSSGVITAVAGVGPYAFGGDGGPATLAYLEQPSDIAVDAQGNIYFSDWLTNRVRKISKDSGLISTIAGIGSEGTGAFSGDGGLATQAGLNQPFGVSVDAQGNVYIADRLNHRIRRVTAATGVINTVAGSGGVGIGNGSFSGDGGQAVAAGLDSPRRVSVGPSGDVFVLDANNSRVRKIQLSPGLGVTDNVTGLWWNPDESGWGLNFSHQGSILFATLFIYDKSGLPTWFVASSAELQSDGRTFQGELYQTSGSPYNSPIFQPIGAGGIRKVGTFVVSFPSSAQAFLRYDIDGVVVEKAIRRLEFASPTPACQPSSVTSRSSATNYQDLWWNASESGWGLNIAHQGSTLFATLFVYDSTGKPTWFVMSAGARQQDGSFSGDLYKTAGASFDTEPFPPVSASGVARVGTMRLSFADGQTGGLTYSVNGETVNKAIVRLVFSSPVPNCR